MCSSLLCPYSFFLCASGASMGGRSALTESLRRGLGGRKLFCSFACLLAIHGEYARWEGWLMLIVRAIIGVFFIPPLVSLHCRKIPSRPGLSLIHMSCSFENSWLKVAKSNIISFFGHNQICFQNETMCPWGGKSTRTREPCITLSLHDPYRPPSGFGPAQRA